MTTRFDNDPSFYIPIITRTMTTSNSITWELNRDQIISAAMRKLGILNKGDSPDSTELSEATIALNGLIGRFNTLGMPLWKRTTTETSLVASTQTYTFSTGAMKTPEVYLRNLNASNQYKIEQKSYYDLTNLPYSTEGVPNCWCFTPNLAEGGTITVWPIPDSSAASNYSLIVVYQDEVDNFVSSADTPDFPAYWTDAVVYGLASALAPEYGIPLPDRAALEKQATLFLAQAQSYGDEDGSFFISPETRW